ncbi:MAG: hypothetical protein JSR55_07440, partial [Proteobacteria bacterium]|nr:hypothetical protein [Pseudomonadota bacterium]
MNCRESDKAARNAAQRPAWARGRKMNLFERGSRAHNGLLRRATAIAAATALIYMPLLSYAPAAYADTTISTNTTGNNGGNGGGGSYSGMTGGVGGGAGGGASAGDGSGTSASGG